MTRQIARLLSDSRAARWTVVALVSLSILCGYILTDVMAPLKTILEQQLGWDSTDYGVFTSGYGWFNIFLFMLILGGIVLDKMGLRFTGILCISLMIVGAAIKYWAVSTRFADPLFVIHIGGWELVSLKRQVLFAALGFAIFGVGLETTSITASKAVVKWFRGKELALALGVNVAIGRVGTLLALWFAPYIAQNFKTPSAPILLCLILLCVSLVAYLAFCVMDAREDREAGEVGIEKEDFRLSDILNVVRIRAFWYISLLCLTFYGVVFPFLKFGSDLMVQKFGVSTVFAGTAPGLIPMGTMVFTPLFGYVYDRYGKGATLMIVGCLLLTGVMLAFALPFLDFQAAAYVLMVLLGLSFSLVPAAMWPSMAKVVDQRSLGTGYALIFWIQNWGISGVPLLIGWVLDRFCRTGVTVLDGVTTPAYDYTYPMLVFAALAALSVLFAFLLKGENARKGYGLQEPNCRN